MNTVSSEAVAVRQNFSQLEQEAAMLGKHTLGRDRQNDLRRIQERIQYLRERFFTASS